MKQVWQRHHLTYPDGKHHPPKEWVVSVTRGEHHLITQLQRFGSLSEGAFRALMYELARKPVRHPEAKEADAAKAETRKAVSRKRTKPAADQPPA